MAETPTLRNRIKEFHPAVDPKDLIVNEKNWRQHPYAQQKAIAELLEVVGVAGALTAYRSKENPDKLTLIDGHERLEAHPVPWPVIELDVDDQDADRLLLTMDPVTGMAETDGSALNKLLDDASTGTPALEDLFRELRLATVEEPVSEDADADEATGGPPEMELQPFEHYDYMVVLFRSSLDWAQAVERFGLRQPEAFTLKDGEHRKIGKGRVIDGSRLLEQLK
jgi:hypothetical protein